MARRTGWRQRIGDRERLDRQVRVVDRNLDRPGLDAGLAAADFEQSPRADAEERVSTEPLAALDRLEQVRRPAVVEPQEGADRGLEVGRARGAQQDRVRVGGQTLRLRQADRVGCRHRDWPRESRTTVRPRDERSCLPRCHPHSAMPHSRDRRAGRLRDDRSALPCIAGALRRSLLAPATRCRFAFGPEAPGSIPCRRRSGSHQPPDLWVDARRVLVPINARSS